MEQKKSYYAIIPANVRYDKKLTPNAKLLYGEITALCNEKGYCWAGNGYFSELYEVSKVSISKWINQLAKQGYIETHIQYKEGSKEILNRYITIVNHPIKEKFNTPQTKVKDPHKEKFKENNTSNNTSNNTENKGKTPTKHKYGEFNNVLLTDEEFEKLKNKYPNDLNQRIERLSDYVASTGKSYKSHYATIISWANRDKSKKPQNDTFQNTRNSQEDTEITPEMMKAYEELKQNERA